jgi:hypothetical protein
MADVTLYEMLGISKERAEEVAKRVRASFSESKSPLEWITGLKEEFCIDQKNAEIFACGWFAGKYAGVSEVFNAVQRGIDEMEMNEEKKREKESKYLPPDGYA